MLEFHPLAALFPLMQGEEFEELKKDIADNGLKEAIRLYEGKILDGRNRYRACEELGFRPAYKDWDGIGSALGYIVSLNLKRRHLNASQRAAIAVEALPLFEGEAKKRQATSTGGKEPQLREKLPEAEKGKATDQVGKLFGVSGRMVSDAKVIKESTPEVLEEIKKGNITLHQAKRDVIQTAELKKVSLPDAKFRVIYADPPWKYGNTMPDYAPEQADHYQLMTVDEICALPISERTEENAVLFLWATSPILEEAFQVIRAWGFKYKASFVWDKIKHNMGHYNSVRHEFLLVCVKGSCQPEVHKLFDSVVSVERTKHSEKPEIFREMIDSLYPTGRRLELFARKAVMNWDGFGNELP